MRISQEEKSKVHQKILRAGVDLIGKAGFNDVSMRQIAQAAGVGEATVYRYFPNKYELLCAYFLDVHERTIERVSKLPEFATCRFVEQLQILTYTQLDLYGQDRSFVAASYDIVLKGGFLKASNELNRLKENGLEVITEILDAAVAAGEFPEPPMKRALCRGMLDMMIALGFYWTKDESPKFQNTLQLVDKSLALVDGILASNLLGGFADLIQFFFREHVVNQWSSAGASLHNFDFASIKRRMEKSS